MTSQHKTLLCQYHYDALDRLTSNELPNEPERQRFYCKSRLTTEIQGANRYSVFQHGDQLLAQQQRDSGSSGTTLLATDQQRSVLQALKINQPRQPIAYTPYGHRPAGNGLLSLLGFNGEPSDQLTGWYFLGNGYRAFNPVLMRFDRPDNLSPFGKGGLNAYAYCAGNPISRADPTGHGFIKNLVISMSQNTTPVALDTINALRRVKKLNFGTTTQLKQMAAAQRKTPQQLLIEETINYQVNDIGINFSYLENPGFKITDIQTINRVHYETTTFVNSYLTTLRELRHKNIHLISGDTLANANKTLDRANHFLNDEALRVTETRIKRLKREKVLNYEIGDPPHYEEQLFPDRSDIPSASNNRIRGG